MNTMLSWTRFLQSTSKGLNVKENEALQQHGAATVTCLLSGFDVFCHTYAEQDRALRVAKGLHGLHVYATEFWTEYLLSWAVSECPRAEDDSGPLLSIACKLAASMNGTPATTIPNPWHPEKMMDKRLQFLKQHPMLQELVNQALQARSLESLESRVLRKCLIDQETQQRPNPPIVPDGISKILASYQEVVKSLVGQKYHSELSTDEFELFKVHFGATAYTCQLTSCSRATIGFETEELLKEHEKCHIRWFQCTVPECQFPSFVSARALKSHTRKHHTVTVTVKAIRRPRTGIDTPIWADERLVKLRNTDHPQNDAQSSRITHAENQGSFDTTGEYRTQYGSRSITNSPSLESMLPGVRKESMNDKLLRGLRVFSDGTLTDGREYAVSTFTIPDRGDTLFMLYSQCYGTMNAVTKDMLVRALQECPSELFALSLAQKQDLISRGILDKTWLQTACSVVKASFAFMVCGDMITKEGLWDYYNDDEMVS
jgi:hypothetical protein